jgi:hypothetical protein
VAVIDGTPPACPTALRRPPPEAISWSTAAKEAGVTAKDAGRALVMAVLLAVAAGACGGSGGGADGGGGGQGGSNGQGQNQQGAAIEVLPASSFDPGPNGGADLPEPTFLIVVRECYAALRARSFDVLAPRMTAIIESAGAGADRGVVVAARLCRGLANLNDGALAEAARDLTPPKAALVRSPEIRSTSWSCCCCAGRWWPARGSSGSARPAPT